MRRSSVGSGVTEFQSIWNRMRTSYFGSTCFGTFTVTSVASRNCAPLPSAGSHACVTSSTSRLVWPLLNGACPAKVTLCEPGLDGSDTAAGLVAAWTVPARRPVATSPRAVDRRIGRRRRGSCMNRSVAIRVRSKPDKNGSLIQARRGPREQFAGLSMFPASRTAARLEERAAEAAAAAAKLRYRDAIDARHRPVVEAGAATAGALRRPGDQPFAYSHRLEKADVRACGHGALVVGVARERERGVGEGEDVAAVADAVAVGHVLAHHHRRGCASRRDVADLDAQPLARPICGVHGLGATTSDVGGVRGIHRLSLASGRARLTA